MKGTCNWLLSAFLVFLPAYGSADWTPPQPVSNSAFPSRTQYNFGWAIDVDGAGVVHAAWLEVTSPDPPGYTSGRVDVQPVGERRPALVAADAAQRGAATLHRQSEGGRLGSARVRGLAWNARRQRDFEDLSPALPHPRPFVESSAHHFREHAGGPRRGVAVGQRVRGRRARSVGRLAQRRRGNLSAQLARRGQDLDGGATRLVRPTDARPWVPTVACWGAAVHVAWSDERHNVDAAGQPGRLRRGSRPHGLPRRGVLPALDGLRRELGARGAADVRFATPAGLVGALDRRLAR